VTGSDRAAVLARIAGSRAPLKILVKTRDDPFFVGDWIAHHAALVGAGNLVILDNGSSDPGVLATYAGLRGATPILRVDGYYNDVHRPARCPDLYEALRAGSDHFLFLDTDEFLASSDGTTLRAERAALAPLGQGLPGDFVPTTRLDCVALYRDRFVIGTAGAALRRQLKWGKPIVRSGSSGWPELMNHNLHVRGALAPHACPGFFILHFNHLSPEQRIRNNVNKLVGRGFMAPDEPLEPVLARPVPDGAWMIAIYLDEIRRMLALRGRPAPADAPLAPGTLRVAADGTLAFAAAAERDMFRSYVERFGDAVREGIIEGRWPSA
jgi:hypothetical protein